MPTFQRTETVDARQFTGGKENGMDLVFWVNSNGGSATWKDETQVAGKTLSERIVLHSELTQGLAFDLTWVGDWVVHHQDGRWEAIRPELMAEEYKQV